MTQVNDQAIREMVEKVLQHVQGGWGGRVAPTAGQGAPPPISSASAVPAAAQCVQGGNQFGQLTKSSLLTVRPPTSDSSRL